MTLNVLGFSTAAVAGFATVALVVRGFGAAASGVFFEAVAVATILGTVAQAGTPDAVVWRASSSGEGLGRDDTYALRVALPVVTVLSAALGLAVLAIAPGLAQSLTTKHYASTLTTDLRWASVAIAPLAVTAVLLASSRTRGGMGVTVVVEYLLKPGGRLLFALAAVYVGSNALLVSGWVVPAAVALAVGWVAVQPSVPASFSDRPPFDRAFWTFAALRGTAAGAQSLVVWIDLLIVGYLLAPQDVGRYAAISRFIVALALPLAAAALAGAPLFSDLIARGDERLKSLYAEVTALLAAGTAPLCAGVIIFAHPLLGAFGADFGPAVQSLRIIAVAALINSSTGPIATVILMGGRSGLNLAITAIGLGTNIVATVAFGIAFGLVGAAAGWAATVMVTNAIGVVTLGWNWGVFLPLRRLAASWLVGFFGMAAVAGGAGHLFGYAAALATYGCCVATYGWILLRRVRGWQGSAARLAGAEL